MSNKVTFYYNPMSRGRIAHWMLEEVEAEYEIKLLNWETNDQKSPEYLKVNPMGKIPTIIHRDVVVTEAAAICAYLADAFPKANLAPAVNDPKRGSYYRWLFFAASCIEPAMFDKTHPRTNNPTAGQMGHGNYDNVVATLELAVANGFLVGDQFTAADVYLSSQIGWSIFTKNLDKKSVFTDYLRRCQDRPAFKRYMDKAGPLG